MKYEIRFSGKAEKQILRLDPPVADRIRLLINGVNLSNPRSSGKALQDSNLWAYRAGDYRVLASIQDDVLLILVVEVCHRSRMCKPR
ncbi:type II toxin-antitoxin system RelE/ParE family toxin [Aquiluna sp.]|nr:type II toxin-antitoxin system RelE/ParE family toxin [Aquiluna sp.]